jgi:3-methyladenine DNA glycosylase AlkC
MSPRESLTEKPRLWKDHLGPAAVTAMAASIRRAYPPFDATGFLAAAKKDGFDKLELKARVSALALRLKDFLPHDYRKAIGILINVAPDVGGFENWVLTSYVEQFGPEHFQDSVYALRELTQFFSCEFAIRPFMIRYTDRMMPILHEWAEHPNEHVRRLAAEGSRPRGVWTAHIEVFRKDPRPVIKLLERLKADPSLYVRKAVANNLNDISKDHPDVVIKTALEWRKDRNPYTDWILKRACRSLVKIGHAEVFEILGFAASPRVEITRLATTPRTIKIGDNCSIKFTLKSLSKKSQRLVIDYKIHYVKASGRRSPKLFKLFERTLKAGETVAISTNHSFLERSTRAHYPGAHEIEIMINGRSFGRVEFKLTR